MVIATSQENALSERKKVTAEGLYLDLMKKCLVNLIYGELEAWPVEPQNSLKRKLIAAVRARGMKLVWDRTYDPQARLKGEGWPAGAHTMMGIKRLENLQYCVEDSLKQGVGGDLIETGVWRGGATIFMRAILKAYAVTDRRVWVADSFAGLPPPNPARYPADADDQHHTFKLLAVSLDEVKANFEKYELLDDQVCFLQGWFSETLPGAPIKQLAVIRLDGDMYESTIDALSALYPKLSRGGYLIVDDYALPGCKQAVDDYREAHRISEEILPVDGCAVYWRRIV